MNDGGPASGRYLILSRINPLQRKCVAVLKFERWDRGNVLQLTSPWVDLRSTTGNRSLYRLDIACGIQVVRCTWTDQLNNLVVKIGSTSYNAVIEEKR